MSIKIDTSPAYAGTAPKLSVLVPFYKDDAAALM